MSSVHFDYTRLAGDWWNELGSHMHLVVDAKGGLSGTYHSRVGGVPKDYPLAGRFDVNAEKPATESGVTLGWAVTYFVQSIIHSTATWSGQFFDDSENRDNQVILTHWLLTRTTTKADLWNSTNLGTDSFTRTPPSANFANFSIERPKVFSFASPHVEDIVACLSSSS